MKQFIEKYGYNESKIFSNTALRKEVGEFMKK